MVDIKDYRLTYPGDHYLDIYFSLPRCLVVFSCLFQNLTLHGIYTWHDSRAMTLDFCKYLNLPGTRCQVMVVTVVSDLVSLDLGLVGMYFNLMGDMVPFPAVPYSLPYFLCLLVHRVLQLHQKGPQD